MSFDDDLRRRLDDVRPVTTSLDGGPASVRAAARRRSRARRGVAATIGVSLVVAGVVGAVQLSGGDDTSELDVTDTTPPTTASTTTSTSEVPAEPDVPGTTGVVTVDVDGVVRLNGEVIDDRVPESGGEPEIELRPVAVDGDGGRLVVEANAGIWLDGVLHHKGVDARLLDVTGDERLRTAVAWTIPAGNTPSGLVIGIDEWGEGGDRSLPLFSVAHLGDEVTHASFGGEGLLLLSVRNRAAACDRLYVTDLGGEIVDDHVVNRLSRCFEGEIAGWSDAAIAVLARPTDEDAWVLDVLDPAGGSRTLRVPGAFQPRRIDVHTGADGRTSALILGTGEELVYVDANAFLSAADPARAVLGISNDHRLISARFVQGFAPPHRFRAELDARLAESVDFPPGGALGVWRVTGVRDDDLLYVRRGPGAETDMLFALAPRAIGVVSIGDPVEVADGGRWLQVYAPRVGSAAPTGWVNAAFLEPMAVTDDRPCRFNADRVGTAPREFSSADVGDPASDAVVVGGLDTFRFGACIRTIITFDSEFEPDGATPSASGLPPDLTAASGSPLRIDLGDSIVAAQAGASELRWPFDQRTHHTYVTIDPDGGLSVQIHGPSELVDVRFDPGRSAIVVDVADANTDAPPGAEPAFDAGTVVITEAVVENERFTFRGLARPFEATLDVSLRNAEGPVAADWTGTIFVPGPEVATNAVMTSGWAEGWGRFEFSILLDENEVDGLLIDFDPSGGAGDVPTVVTVPLWELTEFSQPPAG